MADQADVFKREGPRGGKYYAINLSDGRQMDVLRDSRDRRVWLGRLDEPGSFNFAFDCIPRQHRGRVCCGEKC